MTIFQHFCGGVLPNAFSFTLCTRCEGLNVNSTYLALSCHKYCENSTECGHMFFCFCLLFDCSNTVCTQIQNTLSNVNSNFSLLRIPFTFYFQIDCNFLSRQAAPKIHLNWDSSMGKADDDDDDRKIDHVLPKWKWFNDRQCEPIQTIFNYKWHHSSQSTKTNRSLFRVMNLFFWNHFTKSRHAIGATLPISTKWTTAFTWIWIVRSFVISHCTLICVHCCNIKHIVCLSAWIGSCCHENSIGIVLVEFILLDGLWDVAHRTKRI